MEELEEDIMEEIKMDKNKLTQKGEGPLECRSQKGRLYQVNSVEGNYCGWAVRDGNPIRIACMYLGNLIDIGEGELRYGCSADGEVPVENANSLGVRVEREDRSYESEERNLVRFVVA